MAGYNNIELRITPLGGNTISITDFARWESAVFVFEEGEDELSYKVELENVIILRPAADIFINPSSLRFDVELILRTYSPSVPNISFVGEINLQDVEFITKDMAKVNIRLDGLDRLLAKAQERLTKGTHETMVLIEPKRDASVLGLLGLFASLVYMIIKTAADIITNRAIYAAIFGAGVGGPVSSQIFLVVSLIMQALVLAILIAALIRVVRDLIDFIRRSRPMCPAFQLYQSIQNIAAQAGYTTVNLPNRLRNIYIVTPPSVGQEDWGKYLLTGKEVIDAAKISLNARVLIVNNQLRFVPARPFSVLPPNHPFKREYFEKVSYETSELPNILHVGALRDPAEGYSFDYVPSIFERIVAFGFGQKKRLVPFAVAKIKMTDSPFDRAMRYFTVTIYVITAGLAFLVAVLLQVLGVLRQYDARYGHIIVEAEGWQPKIIECDDISKPGGGAEQRWLRNTAQNYPARLFKQISVKVPLSTQEFYDLFINGFPNTKSLRWSLIGEYAEVTYLEEHPANIQTSERYV